MAREREAPTLADYVVLVVSPGLIMALVGSLVFFLAEVLYAGAYGPQLRWMLFFFVLGAVLIARISLMGEISGRAGLYGIALAIVVWLAMLRYVDYPPGSAIASLAGVINLGLIGLVWWCAHKLVYDCTHLEEDDEVTG